MNECHNILVQKGDFQTEEKRGEGKMKIIARKSKGKTIVEITGIKEDLDKFAFWHSCTHPTRFRWDILNPKAWK